MQSPHVKRSSAGIWAWSCTIENFAGTAVAASRHTVMKASHSHTLADAFKLQLIKPQQYRLGFISDLLATDYVSPQDFIARSNSALYGSTQCKLVIPKQPHRPSRRFLSIFYLARVKTFPRKPCGRFEEDIFCPYARIYIENFDWKEDETKS